MSGTLYIAGGALRTSEREIFSSFVESAGGPTAKFAFIVAASGEGPDATFRSYVNDFGRLGVPADNCALIPLYAKHVVDERGINALSGDNEMLPALFEGVTGVWFTGGDQYFVAQCILRPDGSHTKTLDMLHRIYERGGAIGGSSAGAAIMSHVMIGDGNNRGMLYHDTVFGYDTYDEICRIGDPAVPLLITRGLGFFPDGIVDQHFNARPRMLRTLEACLANVDGARVAFGVSEDTALVYRSAICEAQSGDPQVGVPGSNVQGCHVAGHDAWIEVLGSGAVYIMDCRRATRTAKGCYDGVLLHSIQKGDRYNTSTGDVVFAVQSAVEKLRYGTPDLVNGATIDSPGFDEFMDVRVLRAPDEGMYYCAERDKRYARGVAIYEAHEKTYAVLLKYFRDAETRGYRSRADAESHHLAGHTSFANMTLKVDTKEVTL